MSSFNIVIDQGNTNTKVAIFKGNEPYKFLQFSNTKSVQEIDSLISGLKISISSAVISSVDALETEIITKLQSFGVKTFKFNEVVLKTMKSSYSSPKTLGEDRLAMSFAAIKKYPNSNILIIALGTCITYNYVTENTFIGGAISPGMHMRFKSLNYFTDRLPLIKNVKSTSLIGDNTDESILSGVVNGITAELRETINQYLLIKTDLKVILTGGDACFFDKQLKKPTFVHENLVLEGLNLALQEK